MRTTLFQSAGDPLPNRGPSPVMLDLIESAADDRLGPVGEWPPALQSMARMVLFSRVPKALLVGTEARLIYNDAFLPLLGPLHPAALGRPAAETWPAGAPFVARVVARVFAGETVTLRAFRIPTQPGTTGPGSKRWFDMEFSPVLSLGGKPIAVLARVQEVTRTVEDRKRLADAEIHTARALAAAGVSGVWTWLPGSDRLSGDAGFAALFRVDPERAAAGAPVSAYLDRIHPEDRAELRRSLDAAAGNGAQLSTEVRLYDSGQDPCWISLRGDRIGSRRPGETRYSGIAMDWTGRKEAEAALRASEQRFRLITDSMPQTVWSTGPDGRTEYVNAHWYEFTGTPPGTGRPPDWGSYIAPEDVERVMERWTRACETGEDYEDEFRLRHAAGGHRWVLVRARPMRDPWGRIASWFGTATDIHEQRMITEERALIAREFGHRIKNVYTVLSGLISLSARAHPEATDFADTLKSRIHAMSTVHDLVRPRQEDAVQGMSLHGLVREILSPFTLGSGPELTLVGEDIPLPGTVATPLALVLHELATNAAKYGGLSPAGAGITVETGQQGGRATLSWTESAPVETGQAPGQAPRHGFGSQLLELSIEGQLGGSFTRDLRPDGLRFRMEVPLG